MTKSLCCHIYFKTTAEAHVPTNRVTVRGNEIICGTLPVIDCTYPLAEVDYFWIEAD